MVSYLGRVYGQDPAHIDNKLTARQMIRFYEIEMKRDFDRMEMLVKAGVGGMAGMIGMGAV